LAQKNTKLNSKTLIKLYEDKGMTLREIAGHFNVSHQLISNILRREGVTRRGHGTRRVNLDLEKIKKLYFDRGLSLRETADIFGVSLSTIRARLMSAGFRMHSSGFGQIRIAGRRGKYLMLKDLKIGEYVDMQCSNIKARRSTLHRFANSVAIRLTITTIRANHVRVTRVG
jgi:transposase